MPLHAGAGIKDQDTNILTNQRTLASFLVSARQFLTRPNDPPLYTASGPLPSTLGEVHITLKSGMSPVHSHRRNTICVRHSMQSVSDTCSYS